MNKNGKFVVLRTYSTTNSIKLSLINGLEYVYWNEHSIKKIMNLKVKIMNDIFIVQVKEFAII